MKKLTITIALAILMCSCVTSKKYNALADDYSRCSQRLKETQMKNTELTSRLGTAEQDLERCNSNLNKATNENEKLTKENALARQENEELNKQLRSSNSRINEVLNDKSKHLTELSNELNKKEMELLQKEHNLDSLQNEFLSSQKQLQQMKDQLEAKNQQLDQIQTKLKNALLGFTDKGLTIETKDGKVYVSMEEKLLFSSGSWQVSSEGIKALGEIAVVLSNNPDIDIMVEGHTDNVPLAGKNQIKDNWDLSVMRATSITKILLDGTGITPTRIIPCGRGEYLPISDNKTPEHRAKNRRTEIILSPKVNELLNIIK
ncbi:MAG: OmpA family protein [Bacteroidales bacterium]|nr:OmpA family protein [Candidatus Scybalousia scybalohippi]